jgi:DNA-binding beta-propeller fold protein YncE
MPHMITVDGPGNVWVVDCGLHQVLKYAVGASGEVDFSRPPALELGVKLQPGSGDQHFCKPTDVAIKADGGFFVSDGYCNSRVISYTANGKIIKQWGSFGRKAGQFNLPHALAWDEDRRELFVADRMNSRVQVFSEQGQFLREYGGRGKGWGLAFGLALAASPQASRSDSVSKLLYISTVSPSAVFVVEAASGRPIGSFDTPRGVSTASPLMPHDVGVTASGTVFVGYVALPHGLISLRTSCHKGMECYARHR